MPAQQPPAQPVVQQQQQQQQQTNPVVFNNNETESNETNSRSQSDNVNNLQGELSNIQVNNNIDSFFQYERGVRLPATTLNISTYGNRNDFGVVATLSIPIGKQNKRLAYDQINARINETKVDTIARKLSACASIEKAGYTITNYEAINFEECKYISKRQAAIDSTDRYLQEIKKQRIVIDKLLKRLDRQDTERNNPFKSRG